MPRPALSTTVPFFLAVGLCLGQVVWWTYYQVAEARRQERTALDLLAARGVMAAVRLEQRHHREPFADAEAVRRWLAEQDPPMLLNQDTLAAGIPLIEWAPDALKVAQTGWISPHPDAAAAVLDESRRRVRMFLWEGSAFSLAVLAGILVLAMALRREVRLRAAQERFLAGATHELKTPLATLRLGLQSIGGGRLGAEQIARYTTGMLEQVERLEHRVVDMLAAAEVAQGRRAHALTALALDEEVAAVCQELLPRFTGLGLRLEVAPLPQVRTLGERDGLRTVLRNLLDNAAKYSDAPGTVTVALTQDRDTAVLAVRDQGIGVAPAEAERIFGRFYRSQAPAAQVRGGAGLGLYLVREIVERHGGTVRCHSDGAGTGTTFEVRLPIRSAGATS